MSVTSWSTDCSGRDILQFLQLSIKSRTITVENNRISGWKCSTHFLYLLLFHSLFTGQDINECIYLDIFFLM